MYYVSIVANKRPHVAAFGNLDESDDECHHEQNDVKRVNKFLESKYQSYNEHLDKNSASAIAEDPSIFDFDGTYDNFKAAEVKKHKLSQQTIATKEPPVWAIYKCCPIISQFFNVDNISFINKLEIEICQ